MTRHILPRSLPPVLVLATAMVGEAIVLEAALSYLGLGVPPPQPSWGGMIFDGAHNYLETAPWLTVVPGLALTLTALSFALLGDALRDRMDGPRVGWDEPQLARSTDRVRTMRSEDSVPAGAVMDSRRSEQSRVRVHD